MLGVARYFWRLIPGNPILLRVLEVGGRRRRDLIIRWGYLGLLILVVVVSLLSVGGVSGGLSELAQMSGRIFERMSYLQLALVALLAPIFTAGAITQEKDSQTYDILLSTPLSNGQIVLGSLLSRLFFVLVLLLSGIPIFAITQIFGGVTIRAIVVSFAIAAATAFITGALAMAIATFGVGTRRTIFGFYLFIAAYLVGLYFLDDWGALHPTGMDGMPLRTSWLTGIHPFLALRTLFDRDYLPPGAGDLPAGLRGWFMGWYWTHPAGFFITFMSVLGLLIVSPSILLLRRVAQSSTSLRRVIAAKLRLWHPERQRVVRGVWSNPIAWREARTRSSAARSLVLRYGFAAAGLIAAGVMVWLYAMDVPAGRFISATGYNAESRQLTVYQTDGPAQTYRVAKDVEVKVQGQKADASMLGGDFAVLGEMSVLQSPAGPIITGIKLGPRQRRLPAELAGRLLMGAVMVELAVILLIVTNAAASTVTREREDGTLDLLLSTPITSQYYLWGKLRGLVSYVLPLVAVPVLSVAAFVVVDYFTWIGSSDASANWLVFPEAVLLFPGVLVMAAALGAVVGMQMSLRCRTTVMAVMSSVGIMLGLYAALWWLGYQMMGFRAIEGPVPLAIASLSPFSIVAVFIDPGEFGMRYFATAESALVSRALLFTFGWIVVGVYGIVVWSMYRSMVKNFDMTIRK